MSLENARKFAINPKARHVKNVEVWAYAICLKALKDCCPKYSCYAFPNHSLKVQKVIENKRWQLDKLLN